MTFFQPRRKSAVGSAFSKPKAASGLPNPGHGEHWQGLLPSQPLASPPPTPSPTFCLCSPVPSPVPAPSCPPIQDVLNRSTLEKTFRFKASGMKPEPEGRSRGKVEAPQRWGGHCLPCPRQDVPPPFSLYLKAPFLSRYNTVNKAGIPGQDSRPIGTFMHCVGHNEVFW